MWIKALSLWEPWASLMRCGAKTIETRSWPTKYRGPVLICASKRWSRDQKVYLCQVEVQRALGVRRGYKQDMFLGQAVAVVDLFDCVETGNLSTVSDAGQVVYREQAFGDYSTGRYAWFTRNLRRIAPFPVTGRQGLFEVELGVDSTEQLAAR